MVTTRRGGSSRGQASTGASSGGGGGALANNPLYNIIRYQLVPPFFLLFFTGAAQILALLGRGQKPCPFDFEQCHRINGSTFAWTFVGCFTLWAYTSLRVPGATFLGPPTPDGYRPSYKDNGVTYYLASLLLFLALQAVYPSLSTELYEQLPEILGVYNTVALVLCAFLLFSARKRQKNVPISERKPLLFDFYRGSELHPRLFDCDVKQFTICRIGMMLWQLLTLAFFIAEYQRSSSFSPGSLVTLALQTVYLAKFFYWETGYFNTLDITYDRAGYYLCWGCLVWVQITYTFHSYHMVQFPSQMTPNTALMTFLTGLGFIALNYRVDYEKQVFAAWWQKYIKDKNKAGKCTLWGKPVTYVETTYKTNQGEQKRSALLTSGFWGLARHDNYTFELGCAFCWCVPAAVGYGPLPLVYFYFLVVLLVHRIYRDEDKCAAKYGPGWEQYCKVVKYRMIPYIY